jgi:hypothetical protein
VQVFLSFKQTSANGKAPDHRRSAQSRGDDTMLGIIAAVLIVLWLMGFFAFHVTSAFIHVALVIGIILLAIHFMRRTSASA